MKMQSTKYRNQPLLKSSKKFNNLCIEQFYTECVNNPVQESWDEASNLHIENTLQGLQAIKLLDDSESESEGKTQDTSSNSAASINTTCRYYLKGYCNQGTHCRYYHPKDKLKGNQKCMKGKLGSSTGDCTLCFSKVENGGLFGLQANCNHGFCLECIKSMGSGKNDLAGLKERYKCPICKVITKCVVPKNLITKTYQKNGFNDKQQNKMKKIKCKQFINNKYCPQGQNCFYNHN